MTLLRILLVLIAVPVNLYPIIYAFRPWWTTAAGRALMIKALGNLILIDLFAGLAFFGDYPGRDVIRVVGLTVYMVGVYYLLAVLIRTPRFPRIPVEERRDRDLL